MSSYQTTSPFDETDRFDALNRLTDSLVELEGHFGSEFLRLQLSVVFVRETLPAAGRLLSDVVSVVMILILQRLYRLFDERVEFQINDRHGMMRFLGFHMVSTEPDFSTAWPFREALSEAGTIKPLAVGCESIPKVTEWNQAAAMGMVEDLAISTDPEILLSPAFVTRCSMPSTGY